MLEISVESKTRTGEDVSGDTFISFICDMGQVCILCDGMGSGKRAQAQSRFAATYLCQLIKSGVSPESAVFSVSSAVSAKNNDDFFSTADILVINGGHARFVKAGAAASIILKGSAAIIAEGVSLPLGIIPSAPCEIIDFDVIEGNKIFMMSDGMLHKTTPLELCDVINEDRPSKKSIIEKVHGSKYYDDITFAEITL